MSRIVEEGNTFSSPMCNRCAHHLGAARCAAFPERIPNAILDGEHDHREPYLGDRGIRFEAEQKR